MQKVRMAAVDDVYVMRKTRTMIVRPEPIHLSSISSSWESKHRLFGITVETPAILSPELQYSPAVPLHRCPVSY